MRVIRYIALVLVTIGLFLARPIARVDSPSALPFAKNFLITGNYVVGQRRPGAVERRQWIPDRHHSDERRAGRTRTSSPPISTGKRSRPTSRTSTARSSAAHR